MNQIVFRFSAIVTFYKQYERLLILMTIFNIFHNKMKKTI